MAMIRRYIGYYKLGNVGGVILLLASGVVFGVLLTEYPLDRFIIITLGIGGLIIVGLKPQWGLILLIFSLPLQEVASFVFPNPGGIFTLSKFFGIYLFLVLFIHNSIWKRNFFSKDIINLWILIYLGVAIISILVAEDKPRAMNATIRLTLLIGYFFLISFMIKDLKTLDRVVWALLIGLFLSILIALSFKIGKFYEKSALQYGESYARFGGLGQGTTNYFAAFVVGIIPLCCVKFFNSRRIFTKIVTLGFISLFLVGFILTYSRGGFIAFSFLITLTIFRFRGELKKLASKKMILSMSFLVIAFFVCFVVLKAHSEHSISVYIERIQTLASPTTHDRSMSSRFEYSWLALKVFLDHPLLGVGMRNFDRLNPFGGLVHNTYLEVLTATGLLGFIPFLIILYLTWKKLKAVQTLLNLKKGALYNYAVALELGFLAFMVSALFVSFDLKKTTWLFIALSSVLWNIFRNQKNRIASSIS